MTSCDPHADQIVGYQFAEVEKQLRKDEGLRLTPYVCTGGAITVGVGTNLDAGITEEEATMLLHNRMHIARREMLANMSWIAELPAPVIRALWNFWFQLGAPRALKFKKMWAALNENRFKDAAAEMLDSKYGRQCPKRAERLANLIREGDEE